MIWAIIVGVIILFLLFGALVVWLEERERQSGREAEGGRGPQGTRSHDG
jgi:hypothetical protein